MSTGAYLLHGAELIGEGAAVVIAVSCVSVLLLGVSVWILDHEFGVHRERGDREERQETATVSELYPRRSVTSLGAYRDRHARVLTHPDQPSRSHGDLHDPVA